MARRVLLQLFGIPFVLIGIYITIGRFFVDAWRRKGTSYGLTTARVIIRSGASIKSRSLRTLSDAEQLWDSLDTRDVAPTPEQVAELRRRRAELQADGDLGEPGDQTLDEIAERGE